jgi:hypothetical protein
VGGAPAGLQTSLWTTWAPSETWVDVQIGDFNGDGKMDLAGRDQATGSWWTALSSGSSLNTSLWGGWNPAVNWIDVRSGTFN